MIATKIIIIIKKKTSKHEKRKQTKKQTNNVKAKHSILENKFYTETSKTREI